MAFAKAVPQEAPFFLECAQKQRQHGSSDQAEAEFKQRFHEELAILVHEQKDSLEEIKKQVHEPGWVDAREAAREEIEHKFIEQVMKDAQKLYRQTSSEDAHSEFWEQSGQWSQEIGRKHMREWIQDILPGLLRKMTQEQVQMLLDAGARAASKPSAGSASNGRDTNTANTNTEGSSSSSTATTASMNPGNTKMTYADLLSQLLKQPQVRQNKELKEALGKKLMWWKEFQKERKRFEPIRGELREMDAQYREKLRAESEAQAQAQAQAQKEKARK